MPKKSAYARAGVDIDAASEAVKSMRKHVYSTFNPNVLSRVGSFGGLFDVSFLRNYRHPILVSSIDGVGTKTMIAEMMDQWTVGQDIVHHCVNDILTLGASPLFFVDYIGAANLKPETMEKIVAEMAKACEKVKLPLISGETAEMQGVYQKGRHDLVGCITGVVEKDEIIDGSKITEGAVLFGLPSNGLHTNGYSLARKALNSYSLNDYVKELGCKVGEELLKVHRCYRSIVVPLLQKGVEIHGIAHITGGGFFDNIGRLLPKGLCAEISKKWEIPPVFSLIQELEQISDQEMRQVFNLGIGMVLVVSEASFRSTAASFASPDFIYLGKIKKARSKEESQKVIFAF